MNDALMFQHDEQIFQRKLNEWGVKLNQPKLIILNCGLGDTIAFHTILPEIRQKYPDKKLVLAVCYNEVFEDDTDVILISIEEANYICGNMGQNPEDYNIYKFCGEKNWNKHLIDAYREMYL